MNIPITTEEMINGIFQNVILFLPTLVSPIISLLVLETYV